jgi:hypothetical protein
MNTIVAAVAAPGSRPRRKGRASVMPSFPESLRPFICASARRSRSARSFRFQSAAKITDSLKDQRHSSSSKNSSRMSGKK